MATNRNANRSFHSFRMHHVILFYVVWSAFPLRCLILFCNCVAITLRNNPHLSSPSFSLLRVHGPLLQSDARRTFRNCLWRGAAEACIRMWQVRLVHCVICVSFEVGKKI